MIIPFYSDIGFILTQLPLFPTKSTPRALFRAKSMSFGLSGRSSLVSQMKNFVCDCSVPAPSYGEEPPSDIEQPNKCKVFLAISVPLTFQKTLLSLSVLESVQPFPQHVSTRDRYLFQLFSYQPLQLLKDGAGFYPAPVMVTLTSA
mgnify:CR=1 FL=1